MDGEARPHPLTWIGLAEALDHYPQAILDVQLDPLPAGRAGQPAEERLECYEPPDSTPTLWPGALPISGRRRGTSRPASTQETAVTSSEQKIVSAG